MQSSAHELSRRLADVRGDPDRRAPAAPQHEREREPGRVVDDVLVRRSAHWRDVREPTAGRVRLEQCTAALCRRRRSTSRSAGPTRTRSGRLVPAVASARRRAPSPPGARAVRDRRGAPRRTVPDSARGTDTGRARWRGRVPTLGLPRRTTRSRPRSRPQSRPDQHIPWEAVRRTRACWCCRCCSTRAAPGAGAGSSSSTPEATPTSQTRASDTETSSSTTRRSTWRPLNGSSTPMSSRRWRPPPYARGTCPADRQA